MICCTQSLVISKLSKSGCSQPHCEPDYNPKNSSLRRFLDSPRASSLDKIPMTAWMLRSLLASYHCSLSIWKISRVSSRGPRTTDCCQQTTTSRDGGFMSEHLPKDVGRRLSATGGDTDLTAAGSLPGVRDTSLSDSCSERSGELAAGDDAGPSSRSMSPIFPSSSRVMPLPLGDPNRGLPSSWELGWLLA